RARRPPGYAGYRAAGSSRAVRERVPDRHFGDTRLGVAGACYGRSIGVNRRVAISSGMAVLSHPFQGSQRVGDHFYAPRH
ncbi:MAG: hypothetical protein LC749_10750, partial [Actinobacteria bacterium]|nr:hypothetical protein [Actinomycetota bacterium]